MTGGWVWKETADVDSKMEEESGFDFEAKGFRVNIGKTKLR